MRIALHIGPEQVGADRLQQVMDAKRGQLAQKGVLYPRSPGGKNHTRLYMAVTDADHIDPLRFNRGFMTADKQAELHSAVIADLEREVAETRPDLMILSAAQLGASLYRESELERLKALLERFSDDISLVAHVDEPARLLARVYADQVMEGRAAPLSDDLAIGADWWHEAIGRAPRIDPAAGQFIETQAAPFWVDFAGLKRFWEGTFGEGALTLRPYDADLWSGEAATEEIRAAFGIEDTIGRAQPAHLPAEPSAAWVARGRQLNDVLMQVLAQRKYLVPRQLWKGFMSEMQVPGEPIDPGTLADVSARFAKANAALGLDLAAPEPAGLWAEADPTLGFRATQYLLAFMYRIDRATKLARKTRAADLARLKNPGLPELSETARAVMPPAAIQNYEKLRTSRFAPHNRLGAVNEEELAAAYTPAPPRTLVQGSTGNVIVGCMKNEAPYIVEWVAYHRAIGVDNFLIYTNDCSDGTAEILDRLQVMGVLQHRDNSDWKGNSPQQYALNRAMQEPVLQNADWIIHIDVDEFMNVRCGNGTLDDFFEHAPDATNVAMTWRMFGHNGVTRLDDSFVIDQFDACAPKYCPKPHTAWGFKTMFRNIGAYGKISCHRPNKLADSFRDKVQWVNGSGQDMTAEAADNGWRNSLKSIGYDLLQLNHYALRSAESFLIKRQRGRALHVDRSIGLNYWIRMDWNDARDITIKRNLPRLRLEYDRLMADDMLRGWHEKGLEWHRAKVAELHGLPEFEELYRQALEVKLNQTERVAYALALDMES